MASRFCMSAIKRYPRTAGEKSDADLHDHMFRHYPTLDAEQRKRVDYRVWRRCVIVECLKRGLISKDPGLGPPEEVA